MKLLPTLRPVPLVCALALALAAPAAWAQAAAPSAAAASAPSFAVRPEVGAALQQAVEMFRAGKLAEARDRIEQAQGATADPQPAERTVMHRLRGLFAMQLDRLPEAAQQLEAALATGAQAPADQLLCMESLARVQFNLKAYKPATEWARKAQAAGSKSAPVQSVLVRATYLQNDFPGTVQLLEAQEKAAGPLSMDDLRILASAHGQLKNDAQYVRLTERLLVDHGRTEYWADLLSRVQRQPGWQPRWDIDLYRLRLQLDLMDEADDYLVLADLAAKAGLPAEAQRVLEAGYAKGLLGKGSGAAEQQKFRAAMAKQAADDRQTLVGAAARAPAVGDARAAAATFNTGAAMVSSGMVDRGLELMKAALDGPLADPAQARLQYGQALAQAGQAPAADEAFKAVAGNDGLGLLARLWRFAAAKRKA
jgi:hypothetical protein